MTTTDVSRLASMISSAIHQEDEGTEVTGTSSSDDGSIYVEGDIDGEELWAKVRVTEFRRVNHDDDDDLDGDEEDE